MSTDRIFLARASRNIEESPEYQPISGVRVIVGEDSRGRTIMFEAGSSSGRVIEVQNPWGTQEIANNLYDTIKGYVYKPFRADGAILDPAAEIGDAISVGDVYSVLADIETTFSPLMTANISAPNDRDIDHEYPYESPENRELVRSLAETKTALIVQEGKISTIVSEIGSKDDEGSIINRLSTVEQTADGIRTKVQEDITTISGQKIQEWADRNFTATKINQKVGYLYDSAGTAQDLIDGLSEPNGALTTLRTSLESEISQTANSITMTVAKAVTKYDTSGFPTGAVINQGYGAPTASGFKANEHAGEYFVNLNNGYYWRSDGTSWGSALGILKTIDATYDTRIKQTENFIRLEAATKSEVVNARAELALYADSIKAQVEGSVADEWESERAYPAECVVKVTQTDSAGTVTGVTYYKRLNFDVGNNTPEPGIGSYWWIYWEETTAPTAQSLIDANLSGLKLSYSSSQYPNSAYIHLNRNGVDIGGTLITMSNVEVDTIAANTYIKSPIICDTNEFGTVRLVAQSSAGQLLYGNQYSTLSDAAFGVSYDPVGGNGTIYVDGIPLAGGTPGFNRLFLGASTTPPTFICYGTWDFSNATVTLPSS